MDLKDPNQANSKNLGKESEPPLTNSSVHTVHFRNIVSVLSEIWILLQEADF